MKLEKFDLEKALNGSKVVTRDGGEVTQLTKFETGHPYCHLYGVVDNRVYQWNVQGKFNPKILGEHNLDLFLSAEPKRIWVNVFMNIHGDLWVGGNQYNSLQEAYKNADDDVDRQYIKTIEITDQI
jgi:hypothetical protein